MYNSHVPIRRLGRQAVGVADTGAQHAQSGTEQRVGAPEAAHAEGGRLVRRGDVMRDSGLCRNINGTK